MGINFDIKNPEQFFSKFPYKRFFAFVCIISSLLIFLPDEILKKIFILELRNNFSTYLGIAFIISLAMLLIIVVTQAWKWVVSSRKFKGKDAKDRFKSLSMVALEKVLRMYKSSGHSGDLSYVDANTQFLQAQGFIGRGNVSIEGMYFDFFLQPWVVEYLDKHYTEYEQFLADQKKGKSK